MNTVAAVRSGDYVSPNLQFVCPDRAFPNMVVGDARSNAWPYLRREITHNWYVDRRWPTVGFISRDEAAIVYNTARQFDNLPCLEIGCWRGWATVHLALGTHSLDVVDPILADPDTRSEIAAMLQTAGVADRVTLVAESSPAAVADIAARTGKRWSMAFVDGDHEGDAPVRDVEMIARHLTRDALILLHDVAAPGPAAALAFLRDHGWRTAVYQTMQILGVATRGSCQPVPHLPDPAQHWSLPAHVSFFPVIGEPPRVTVQRVTVALGGTVPAPDGPLGEDSQLPDRAEVEACLLAATRVSQALADGRAQYAQLAAESQHTRQGVASYRKSVEQDAARRIDEAEREAASRVGIVEREAASRVETVEREAADRVEAVRRETESRIQAVEREAAGRIEELEREAVQLRQDAAAGRRFDDLHARFLRLATAAAAQSAGLAAVRAELAEARIARDQAIEETRKSAAEVRRLTTVVNGATRALAAVDRQSLNRQTLEHERQALEQETARLRAEVDRLVSDLALTQAAGTKSESALALERTATASLRDALATQRTIDRFARDISRPRVLAGLARRAATGRTEEIRDRLTRAFAADGYAGTLPEEALHWLCRTRTLLGLLRRAVLAGRAATQGLVASAMRTYVVPPDEHAVVPGPHLPEVGYALVHLQSQLDRAYAQATAEQEKLVAAHGRVAEVEGKLAAIEAAMAAQAQALYDAQVHLAKLRMVNGSPAPTEVGLAEGR